MTQSANQLWIATQRGVMTLDLANNQLSEFRPTELFDSKIVHLEWLNNTLWIITANKIYAFSKKSNQLVEHSSSTGLRSMQFNFGATYVDKNKIISVGTNQGFVQWSLKSEHVINQKANLLIKQINANQIKLTELTKQADFNHVLLPAKHGAVNIEFRLMDFQQPESNQYFYRLNDEFTWNAIGNKGQLLLPHLPSGRNQLWIKGSSINGLDSAIKTINLEVETPLWRTPVAYTLYILLIVLLNIAVFKYRNRRILIQNQILEYKVSDRTKELALRSDKILESKKVIEGQSLKLKELMNLKDEFFTNVAHELKTPLSLMLIPLQLLKIRVTDNESIDLIETAENNGNQLLTVVEQLLEIENLNVKLPDLNAVCDINAAIYRMNASFENALFEKRINLRVDIKESLTAQCEVGELEKIITNLLSNAIKYTPKNGCVQLSGFNDEEWIQVEISDSGSGIPEPMRHSVFNRFVRLPEHQPLPGSGVGLALVKKIVEQYSGTIYINDSSLGGCQVVVRLRNANFNLNIKANTIESYAPADEDIDLIESSERQKLLIIEDNQELAKLISKGFEPKLETKIAENGRRGIEYAKDYLPDIIISDLMMPEQTGFDVCEQLKQCKETMHIPIIILTAKTDKATQITTFQKLADAFVKKPFQWDELSNLVDSLLETRHRIMRQSSFSYLVNYNTQDNDIKHLKLEKIDKIKSVIEHQFDDPGFGPKQLAEDVAMSRRQLDRQVNEMFGYSARELIRGFRLEKSKEFLNNAHNVTSTAFKVGFNSQTYFSKNFADYYGVSPTEYQKSLG